MDNRDFTKLPCSQRDGDHAFLRVESHALWLIVVDGIQRSGVRLDRSAAVQMIAQLHEAIEGGLE